MIVLGNSKTSASPFVIGHGVMREGIPLILAAVIEALKSVGLGLEEDIRSEGAQGRPG